ncbi:MAG TPA: Ig-like domain-containing protein [Acidimicrobiales bacterium]|nr:Ig-like domain-containing protein [Acidimicrobiales bacterium]
MVISRVGLISGALILATAVGMLPAQDAGASPPSTTVTIPTNNSTVSGTSQVLDAAASPAASQVQYDISGGTLSASVIAIATPTYYGWLAKWNTTKVANGTYALQSVASFPGGGTATSTPVTIVVNNAPPNAVVIIPANGADAGNDDQPILLDALASPGVTSVSIWSNVGRGWESNPATPTIYGWIAYTTPVNLCSANCVTGTEPMSIYAVASYPSGLSGMSPTVSAMVEETIPQGSF